MPRLFKDQDLENKICEKGYAIVPVLPPDVVKKLKNETNSFIKTLPPAYLKGFLSLGRVMEPDLRSRSTQIIREYFIPSLYEYLQEDKVEIRSGVHLIKLPGTNGLLDIHQDSSMVDERKFLSVYAWAPLQHTHKWNGTLNIIPGSHLLGNIHRSLNVYNPFVNYLQNLRKYEIPLSVKPGEVVFFHSALMHSSSLNYSWKKRVAINCFIKPKDAPLTHYFRDEQTPADKVEKYEVPPEFYFEEDIMARPNPVKYVMSGVEDWSMAELSKQEFEGLRERFLEPNSHTTKKRKSLF
jgi:hypothetical protein